MLGCRLRWKLHVHGRSRLADGGPDEHHRQAVMWRCLCGAVAASPNRQRLHQSEWQAGAVACAIIPSTDGWRATDRAMTPSTTLAIRGVEGGHGGVGLARVLAAATAAGRVLEGGAEDAEDADGANACWQAMIFESTAAIAQVSTNTEYRYYDSPDKRSVPRVL
jgi:hypothetical protein